MTAIWASLLNADVGRLAEQVAELEATHAIAGLHVDVMDGRFVPNLAFGPQSVEALRSRTKLPIEVHLMVQDAGPLLPIFHDAGAMRLIVHAEASPHLHRDLSSIERLGAQSGVALNPATRVDVVEPVLGAFEELLLMGVNPGFGGQRFIPSVARKIEHARRMIDRAAAATQINVDGGVKVDNAAHLAALGADRLVVGSALFGAAGIAGCAATFFNLLSPNAKTEKLA